MNGTYAVGVLKKEQEFLAPESEVKKRTLNCGCLSLSLSNLALS